MIRARSVAVLLTLSWLLCSCALSDNSNAKKTNPSGLISTPISYYSTPKAKYLGTKYKENLDRLIEEIVRNPKTAPLQFANNISSVGGIGFFTHSATKTSDERYLEVVLATPETFETKGEYSEKIQRLFSLYGFELLQILNSDNEIYQDRELAGYGLNLAWRDVVSEPSGNRVMLARAIIYLSKEKVRRYLHHEIKQNDLLADAVIFGEEENGPLALVSYRPQDPRPDFRPAIREDNLAAGNESDPSQSASKPVIDPTKQKTELAKREAADSKPIGSPSSINPSPAEPKSNDEAVVAAEQTPASVSELTKGDDNSSAEEKRFTNEDSVAQSGPQESVSTGDTSQSQTRTAATPKLFDPQAGDNQPPLKARTSGATAAVESSGEKQVVAQSTEVAAELPKAPVEKSQPTRSESVESPVIDPVEAPSPRDSRTNPIETKPAMTTSEPASGIGAANLSNEKSSAVASKDGNKMELPQRPANHESRSEPAATNPHPDVLQPLDKALWPAKDQLTNKEIAASKSTPAPAAKESKPVITQTAAEKLQVPAFQNEARTPQATNAVSDNTVSAKSSAPGRSDTESRSDGRPPSSGSTAQLAAKELTAKAPVQAPVAQGSKDMPIPDTQSRAQGNESHTLSAQASPGPSSPQKVVEEKSARNSEITSRPAVGAGPEPARAAPEQLASIQKPTGIDSRNKLVTRPAARMLEGFIIQIAFNDKDKAQHWAEAMERRGYAVSITETGAEGALRVRLGNFAIRDEAERQLRQLKQDGMNGIIISLPQGFQPARSSVP